MRVPYKYKYKPYTKAFTSNDWGEVVLGFVGGVSSEYIKEMVKEREKNYGYLWWIYPKNQTMKIIRKEYNTGKYDSCCANGAGGSLINNCISYIYSTNCRYSNKNFKKEDD